jgi:hypothetical protein
VTSLDSEDAADGDKQTGRNPKTIRFDAVGINLGEPARPKREYKNDGR